MITVIDPAGTPSPVYNRSGKTIVSGLQGGAQTGPNFPTPIGNVGTAIPSFSEITIVVGLGNGTGYVFLLPASADIGTEVIVPNDPSNSRSLSIFGQIGEAIGQLPASTGTNSLAAYGVDPVRGTTFIKVSSTSWQPF